MKRFPGLIIVMMMFCCIILGSCDYIKVIPPPTPALRPDGSTNGSARWAFDIAREKIEAEGYDADNELYLINGVTVWNDGRLPANRGSWEFKLWSESRQLKLEIKVNHAGEISIQKENEPDSPTSRPSLPSNWADSTSIFQAAPVFYTNVVDAAITHWDAWPVAQGEAYWIIGCILSQKCPVHYVQWDGVYLGDEFP